jgi:RND family efflux transporter MFP subunit
MIKYFSLLLLSALCLFAAPQASLVETAPVKQGGLETTRSFVGTLYFNTASKLASQTKGLVLKVNFDATDRVKKGAVLVELDHAILDARISATKASLKEMKLQLEKAQKDFSRYAVLLKQESVSQQKYDEFYYQKIALEQRLAAMKAELESLNIERRQSIIKAPFSGTVAERNVDVGEWVAQGDAVAMLIDPDRLDAIFDIPASYAVKIVRGSAVDVRIAGRLYRGTVEGIVVKGSERSRTFPLKVTIHPKGHPLLEGMEARITLSVPSDTDTLLVPRDAVIKRFNQDVVFINDRSVAKMVPVTVLGFEGSVAAVRAEGLKVGSEVVTKGNERIFPNQPLRTE